METLKLKKETAKKLYKEVPEWFKETLRSTFGKEFFSDKITDRVKTFKDACREAGIEPPDIIRPNDTPDEIAFKKLKVIISVINEGWTPNWSDTNEEKWHPWFTLSSGFGFDVSTCDCTYAGTNVGSHLCFSSKEKCDYVAQQFIELYKDLLT